MDWGAALVSGAVAAAIVTAIGRFVIDPKIEKFKGEILTQVEDVKCYYQTKIESEKADHAKRLHIHSIQFNKQFTVYEHLYRSIVLLHWRLSAIMPMLDSIEKGKTWAEVAPDRLETANKVLRRFIRNFEYNEAFLPPELRELYESILKKVREIRGVVRLEIHYATNGRPPLKLLKKQNPEDEDEYEEDAYLKLERLTEEYNVLRKAACKLISTQVGVLYKAEITD